MNSLDTEIISLSQQLDAFGGSPKLRLSPFCVYIRGVSNGLLDTSNQYISVIQENNEIILRHPSCANDIRCYPITRYFPPNIADDKISAQIVQEITVSVFDGFNMNLLNYGQHSLGKTQLFFGLPSQNSQFDSCEGLLGILVTNMLRKMDQLSAANNQDIKLTIGFWEIYAVNAHKHNNTNKKKNQWALRDLLLPTNNSNSNQKQKKECDSVSAVSVCSWEEICSVWDIAKHNSCNWRSLNTGYTNTDNSSHFFTQIKVYNRTKQTVTTLNVVDMIGYRFTPRESRSHLSKEDIQQNTQINVTLFAFNKFLNHFCNIHTYNNHNHHDDNSIDLKKQKQNNHQSLFLNSMQETLLNASIGPMIAQNSTTIVLGFVSCNPTHYQSSLRTIQILSPLVSVKVPCMINSGFIKKNVEFEPNTTQSVIDFNEFMRLWQPVLYKHLMIEKSIQQQIKNYSKLEKHDETQDQRSPKRTRTHTRMDAHRNANTNTKTVAANVMDMERHHRGDHEVNELHPQTPETQNVSLYHSLYQSSPSNGASAPESEMESEAQMKADTDFAMNNNDNNEVFSVSIQDLDISALEKKLDNFRTNINSFKYGSNNGLATTKGLSIMDDIPAMMSYEPVSAVINKPHHRQNLILSDSNNNHNNSKPSQSKTEMKTEIDILLNELLCDMPANLNDDESAHANDNGHGDSGDHDDHDENANKNDNNVPNMANFSQLSLRVQESVGNAAHVSATRVENQPNTNRNRNSNGNGNGNDSLNSNVNVYNESNRGRIEKYNNTNNDSKTVKTATVAVAAKQKSESNRDLRAIEENEDSTAIHLQFSNLRLENCKLKEENRKLKQISNYSAIFSEYDRELQMSHKLLSNLSKENQILIHSNLKLKHNLQNRKLLETKNKSNAVNLELKTVRILQKTLRTNKSKATAIGSENKRLQSEIQHILVRNKVLECNRSDFYQMSNLLNKKESELAKTYLNCAKTQANAERLELEITQLNFDKNQLQAHVKELENEVHTLRQVFRKYNTDVKKRTQLKRVSKKWQLT